MWAAISSDCRWLSNNDHGLIGSPLWHSDVRENDKLQANFPPRARAVFDKFAGADLAKSTSWGLIVAWYRAILPNSIDGKPLSLFGESADVEIAMQPDKFWDRDPDEVLEAIGKIAGWKPGLSARVEGDLPTGELEGLVKAGDASVNKWKALPKSSKAGETKSDPGTPREPNDPVTPTPAKEEPPLREDVRTHSDEPTARDRLGRRPFAQALVERMDDVRQQGAPDGFAVHIHAPWGAGKTSILLMMEQVMTDAARPPDRQWAVVHFNAWKNERRRPPWWPLIQQTYASCRDTLREKSNWSRWLSVKSCWVFWRFRADWFPYLVAVLAFSAILFFWLSLIHI